jgi:hypothetical protein
MIENNETAKNQEECQNKKCPDCPEVKLKDKCGDPKCVVPPIPDKEHEELEAYKKILAVKRQPIDEIRKNAKREAKKVFDDSSSDNKITLCSAENVFKTAKMKHESDTNKEQTRVDYEIDKICDLYNKALLDASHAIPSLKKCESADDLPDYIKIIYVTEFHQKIAELTIEYQKNLKDYEKVLFDATKVWEQAQTEYCNAECAAKALKNKTDLDADLAWRKSLKTEVDTACTT